MPTRPVSSVASATAMPSPSAPRRSSAVTRRSSNTIWAVSLAVCPSLSSRRTTRKPGRPVGTTKADIPFLPACGSVTAKMMAMSALAPLLMNCLLPLIDQPLPSRRARVARAATSEPACGSVRQKQTMLSPRAIGLRMACFWASVPNLRRAPQPSEFCTAMMVEVATSPAAISSMARA